MASFSSLPPFCHFKFQCLALFYHTLFSSDPGASRGDGIRTIWSTHYHVKQNPCESMLHCLIYDFTCIISCPSVVFCVYVMCCDNLSCCWLWSGYEKRPETIPNISEIIEIVSIRCEARNRKQFDITCLVIKSLVKMPISEIIQRSSVKSA